MPVARNSASVRMDRCGFFSIDSRPQWMSSVWPGPAYSARTASLYRSGLKRSRSVPSVTRVTLGAPMFSNSDAAHCVVQTISSYSRAERRSRNVAAQLAAL